MDIQEYERLLGRWPRRLLHVPSMTSFEWTHGDKYGDHTAPEYNAITYTWGRWRLKPEDPRNVQVLEIKGVPWKIPRIDPGFYTAEHFKKVIDAATRVWEIEPGHHSRVEFIWLDIACIDQRGNEPAAAAEIGRQADIFRNARNVYAWLSTVSHEKLDRSFTTFCQFHEEQYNGSGSENGAAFPENLWELISQQTRDALDTAVKDLFSDPWFSSLWTLQEAFLRQDAMFLSHEARFLPKVDSMSSEDGLAGVTIENLMEGCVSFFLSTVRGTQQWADICAIVKKAGIQALSSRTLLAVYTVTGERRTSRDEDRIYGIQQVFGLRLGKSSPTFPPGIKPPNRSELELELGTSLVHTYPILSQIHVFKTSPPVGRAWMISPDSSISFTQSVHNGPWASITEHPQCQLQVSRRQGTEAWLSFQGLICPYVQLHNASRAMNPGERWPSTSPALVTVHCDNTAEYTVLPAAQENGISLQHYAQAFREEWLSIGLNSEDPPYVLLLGEIHQEFGHVRTYGILAVRRQINQVEYYRRIGVIDWVKSYEICWPRDDELDIIEARGDSWT